MTSCSTIAPPVLVLAAVLASCGGPPAPPASTVPDHSPTPAWLAARQAEQVAASGGAAVLHDFKLVDRVDSSGITFDNPIVEDAGRQYKKVHYDHGTGLAAADVDGDGRPDFYFVSQRGTSQLWKNLGGGRFTNITDSAGLALPDAIAVSASFADIDNDGDPDLFVTTVRHGNHLFENLGGGKFRDITEAAGVGYSGHSSGAVFFDYDGDGRLDFFLCNVGVYTNDAQGPGGYYIGKTDAFHGHTFPERTEPGILYHNLGGNRFADVSKATGLVNTGWSGDASIIDINDDGRPDLYVLNMQGDNHLWVNQGGKRFTDETRRYFPRTPWGAMGVKVFDWNGDGRLDLFVTDMHSDMFTNIPPESTAGENAKSDSKPMPEDFFLHGKSGFIFGNALFTNTGGGKFPDESDAAGAENYWPWGPSIGDLNADGYDDVFIASSMNFPHRYAVNALLLNDAGKRFVRSEFLLGLEPRAGGVSDKQWYVADCAGADSTNAFCQGCAGPAGARAECRYTDAQGRLVVMGTLGTRSAVLVDIDGDGDLDLVTNEFNARPQILVSDLTANHQVHSLMVRLRGTASNREGIGAVVSVTAGGHTQVKLMDGKSGYLSQSDLPLYFGLGSATDPSITVRWPSGKKQTVAGPFPPGQVVEVTEPAS